MISFETTRPSSKDAALSEQGLQGRRSACEFHSQKRRVRDPSDSEDLELVDRFLDGDEEAFEALFDKYREKVYSVSYRFVRNKEDALEVTQEVFLRVYTSLRQFKTDSRFFTWLYRIAVNRSIDFTRSRKTQPTVGVEPGLLDQGPGEGATRPGALPEPGPVQLAQERELEEKLREAVQGLSSKHQAVFVLHASEDLSYKQIAEVLGCSIGTVMSRLFYARRKLKEALVRLGVDVGSGRSGSEETR
ncbi:MAG: sigma-70 family RNA polymerase sigma factor [Planctomycetota bacterium]